MVRVLALILATTALVGCAAEQAPVVQAAPVAAPVAEAPAAPKPTYGLYGFDTTAMDRSAIPGDNFYQYANGTWAKNTAIPADKSNYGAFSVLDDLLHERTREILDQARTDPNSKIGTSYATYLDTASIDATGFAP